MIQIRQSEQMLAPTDIEQSRELKENLEQIDKLYDSWNHYDILPDVIGCLRVRSDLCAPQHLIRESVDALHETFCLQRVKVLAHRHFRNAQHL